MAVGESDDFRNFMNQFILNLSRYVYFNSMSVFPRDHKNGVHSFKNIREMNFYTEIVCLKGERK